jgi:hypothetical protein
MTDRPDRPEPGAHSGMAMTPAVAGWGDRAPGDGFSEASAPVGPGDPAALQQGCRCPTLANRPEAGDALNALVAPDCPMHHPAPSGDAPHHPSALGAPPGSPEGLLPPVARADGVRPDER